MIRVAGAIEVKGLNEFIRHLRVTDRELPKAVRHAGNKAADIVIRDAKPRVPLGPGKHGGHARDSIRAASTQRAVRVRGGSKRFCYYPWLDFGGSVGRHKSVHRPFLKTGRYLWKSFAENQDEVRDVLRASLIEVASLGGLEPRP